MQRARKRTYNIRVFSAELNDRLQERLWLENGLREALKRNQLYLEYQPQVDIRTGLVTGLEALLRWNHRELGLIPPQPLHPRGRE